MGSSQIEGDWWGSPASDYARCPLGASTSHLSAHSCAPSCQLLILCTGRQIIPVDVVELSTIIVSSGYHQKGFAQTFPIILTDISLPRSEFKWQFAARLRLQRAWICRMIVRVWLTDCIQISRLWHPMDRKFTVCHLYVFYLLLMTWDFMSAPCASIDLDIFLEHSAYVFSNWSWSLWFTLDEAGWQDPSNNLRLWSASGSSSDICRRFGRT